MNKIVFIPTGDLNRSVEPLNDFDESLHILDFKYLYL